MTVLFLHKLRERLVSSVPVLAWDVEQWAEHPGHGNLSPESAHAFGGWVEDVAQDGNHDETATVEEFLGQCLERWTGGRTL